MHAHRESRRAGSPAISDDRESEYLDRTIRVATIDPFRVNPLSELRDYPSLASLVGSSDATRVFIPTLSIAPLFDRIMSLQSTFLATRQARN